MYFPFSSRTVTWLLEPSLLKGESILVNLFSYLNAGGVLPYMAYTGTCRWTGYVFFLASLS